MVYVPVLPASEYDRTFTVRTQSYNRVGGVLKLTSDTTSTATRRVEAVSKLGQSGPKIGGWAPVRAYSRSGSRVTLMGGSETAGDAPTVDQCSKLYTQSGLPAIRPQTFIGLVTINAATTDGLATSGVPTVSASEVSQLLTTAMIRVGDRKASYGASIAESRKTLNHLTDTAISLFRAYKAARKGNWRDFSRALGLRKNDKWKTKSAANRWLEFQYAWRPLMGDIYTTSELLRKGMARDPSKLIITGTSKLSKSGGYKNGTAYGSLSGSTTISHRCKLFYVMSLPNVQAATRLGLIDPYGIAWELVPFSFVVDWFVPIGSILEAYSSTWGLTYKDGCISSKLEIKGAGNHTSLPSTHPFLLGGGFGWNLEHSGFKRTKVSNPEPTFYVTNPFNLTRAGSAMALLRSLRR